MVERPPWPAVRDRLRLRYPACSRWGERKVTVVVPKRSVSPSFRRRLPLRRSPLTNVPLRERPSSTISQPSSTRSNRACRRETCSSQSSRRSAGGRRPTEAAAASGAKKNSCCLPSPSRVEQERPARALGLDASLQVGDGLGVGGRRRGHAAHYLRELGASRARHRPDRAPWRMPQGRRVGFEADGRRAAAGDRRQGTRQASERGRRPADRPRGPRGRGKARRAIPRSHAATHTSRAEPTVSSRSRISGRRTGHSSTTSASTLRGRSTSVTS